MSTATPMHTGEFPEPEANYSRGWKTFQFRRMVALVLVFGWLPACVVLFLLSRLWFHLPIVAAALALLWGGLAYGAVWWTGELRCPRCRRRRAALGSKGGPGRVWRGLFDQVCSNCKLRRWEHS